MDLEHVSKKLFLFDFETGKWSESITDPESVEYPAWSSDSRYVEYLSANRVKRVKVGDMRPEDLFSTKGLPIFIVRDFGPWNDNAPDNSRMFLRGEH